MSYNEYTILWAAGASQSIEFQGLQNATFRQSYTVCDSCYVIDISVFNGRVYWAQKYPIYYTQGHLENDMIVEVRRYSNNIRAVDQSCQPVCVAMFFPPQADEAYCIGPTPSGESYLRRDKIIHVAKMNVPSLCS